MDRPNTEESQATHSHSHNRMAIYRAMYNLPLSEMWVACLYLEIGVCILCIVVLSL